MLIIINMKEICKTCVHWQKRFEIISPVPKTKEVEYCTKGREPEGEKCEGYGEEMQPMPTNKIVK
jgi:hypothetical protein